MEKNKKADKANNKRKNGEVKTAKDGELNG